jgi:hypothetical protein
LEDEAIVRGRDVLDPEWQPAFPLERLTLRGRGLDPVEDEGVVLDVVEVAVRLERGHQHPVEGEGEHDREGPDDEPRDDVVS